MESDAELGDEAAERIEQVDEALELEEPDMLEQVEEEEVEFDK